MSYSSGKGRFSAAPAGCPCVLKAIILAQAEDRSIRKVKHNKGNLFAALKLLQQLCKDGHITREEFFGILHQNADTQMFEEFARSLNRQQTT